MNDIRFMFPSPALGASFLLKAALASIKGEKNVSVPCFRGIFFILMYRRMFMCALTGFRPLL